MEGGALRNWVGVPPGLGRGWAELLLLDKGFFFKIAK